MEEDPEPNQDEVQNEVSEPEENLDNQESPLPPQDDIENNDNVSQESSQKEEVIKTEEVKDMQESIPDRMKGIKEILLELLKNTKDNLGRDLYNHLKKMLVHIALTDPMTALDKFEEISYELRTKSKIEIPERFLNYYQLAESAEPWVDKLRERYFNVHLTIN